MCNKAEKKISEKSLFTDSFSGNLQVGLAARFFNSAFKKLKVEKLFHAPLE